jgi:hypothetical protein
MIIDKYKIPKSQVKVCNQCDHELYPKGKILIDDRGAMRDKKGNWVCSDCQETDRRKDLIKTYGPNHVNTRYFIEHEDKKIRKWNQVIRKIGVRQPYRKNKYTGKTIF